MSDICVIDFPNVKKVEFLLLVDIFIVGKKPCQLRFFYNFADIIGGVCIVYL